MLQLLFEIVDLLDLPLGQEDKVALHLPEDMMNIGLGQIGKNGHGAGTKPDHRHIDGAPVVGIFSEQGHPVSLLNPHAAQQSRDG